MKKITFTFYFVFITLFLPQNLKAQDYKIDSTQTFFWDNVLLPMDWLMQNRNHFTYGDGGIEFTNLLMLVKDNGTPNTWLNSFQQIRTFNPQDKLESDIFQIWNGVQFMNLSKSEYTYDGLGNNDVITYFNHNGAIWIVSRQDLMIYNGSNLVTETTSQFWNGVSFDNNSKIIKMYTADLLTQEDWFNWNFGLMDWDTTPFNRTTYNYNGDLVSDKTSQVDNNDGNGLVNNDFYTYTYVDNNLDIETRQSWDGMIWVDQDQTIYTYNVNDLPQEIISSTSTGPSTWLNQVKLIWFWSEAALSINSNNLFEGKAYPNPFDNELTISLQSALENDGLLQIFDISGKEISKTELNQGVKTIKLNNPYLAKGIYFIHVTSNVQKSIFKVIKQ